jgi:hypothetical protein
VSTIQSAPEVLIAPSAPTPKTDLPAAERSDFSSYLRDGSNASANSAKPGKNIFLKTGGTKASGNASSPMGGYDSASSESAVDSSVQSAEFRSEEAESVDSGLLPAIRSEADLPSDPRLLSPIDAALEAAALAASAMLSGKAAPAPSTVAQPSNLLNARDDAQAGDAQDSIEPISGGAEVVDSVPMPTLQAAIRVGITPQTKASLPPSTAQAETQGSLNQKNTRLAQETSATPQAMPATAKEDSRTIISAKRLAPQSPSAQSTISQLSATSVGRLTPVAKPLTPALLVDSLEGFIGDGDGQLLSPTPVDEGSGVLSVGARFPTFESAEVTGEQLNRAFGLGAFAREIEQNATAQNVTAPNVTAPNVTAPNVTAQNVTAQNVTAQNVTAQNVTAQNVTAQNVTAQNVTAQNVTASNKLAEQPVDSEKGGGGTKSAGEATNDGPFNQVSVQEKGAAGQRGADSKFGDNDGSNHSGSQNSQNEGRPSSPRIAANSPDVAPTVATFAESTSVGTQGAGELGEMFVSAPGLESLEVAASSPFGEADSTTNSLNAGSLPFATSATQPTEASSVKVQPPVEVNRADLWDAVREAVMKVSSENPSHISVELRLGDGSSVGVELRMGASGLEASFRSESNALLKSLESQWGGFLSKESPDLRVASAVFEGRSSFGTFSDSGRNGRELRQQMEDSADAATLGAAQRSLSSGKKASSLPQSSKS